MMLHDTSSLSEAQSSFGTRLGMSVAQQRSIWPVSTGKRAESTAAYKTLLNLMGSGRLAQERPKNLPASLPEQAHPPSKHISLYLRTTIFAPSQKSTQTATGLAEATRKLHVAQARPSPASTPQKYVAGAEFYLASLQARLENGDTKTARRIAVAGATRFPQHPALQAAYKLLLPVRATLSPKIGVEPFEILNRIGQESPELKGCWVAVSDGRLVGSSSTLNGLRRLLVGQQLPRPPLVYKLD